MEDAPMHKTVKISDTTKKISTFRSLALLRIIILLLVLRYRLSNPIKDAILVWLFASCCEIMFLLNAFLCTVLKWKPIERTTFPERLSQKYERSGEPNKLLPVDVFIATADPAKEPPITTANTILSVLSVDYPVDKVACYVSDDSASPITLAMMFEVSKFAQKWISFVKQYSIETPAPAAFFSTYSAETMSSSLDLINQMKALKKDYEQFNARLISFVENPDAALNFVRETRGDISFGSPNDHPPVVEVINSNECHSNIPLLVYVAREKRVGYEHHFKAGSMNALLRISEAFTASPITLNLDCDMYVNDSKSLRHAMCFLMDPNSGEDVAFIQFPQIFDNIVNHDLYGGRQIYLYNTLYKGLDSLQSPFYCGTGCFHKRVALYGLIRGAKEQGSLDLKDLGCNHGYVSKSLFDLDSHERDTRLDNSLIGESKKLCTYDYEAQTKWGNEKGWRYGSSTEDVLTGLKIHCQGWKSVYFYPARPAFRGLASTVASERLIQRKRVSIGLGNILFSKSSPFLSACSRLTLSQRLTYIYMVVFYSGTSVFIVGYALLHVACLFSCKSIIPKISDLEIIWFHLAVIIYYTLGYLEFRWTGGEVRDWWNDDSHWMIINLSSYAIGTFEALLISMGILKKGFAVTPKHSNTDSTPYSVSDCPLFIPLVMSVIVFLVGTVSALSHVVIGGMHALDIMGGEMFVGLWSLIILYPFLKQVFGRKETIPRSVMFPSMAGAVIFFLVVGSF